MSGKDINQPARVVIRQSIIDTADSAHRSILRQLERLALPGGKRLTANEQFDAH